MGSQRKLHFEDEASIEFTQLMRDELDVPKQRHERVNVQLEQLQTLLCPGRTIHGGG